VSVNVRERGLLPDLDVETTVSIKACTSSLSRTDGHQCGRLGYSRYLPSKAVNDSTRGMVESKDRRHVGVRIPSFQHVDSLSGMPRWNIIVPATGAE